MLFYAPFDEQSPKYYRISSAQLFDDLNAVEIGYNITPKGLFQAMKRDVFILHYIKSGRGEFCSQKFSAGDGYIVFPNEFETKYSDEQDRCETYWIMFKGRAARDLIKKCALPSHNGVFGFNNTEAACEILHNALFNITPANKYEEAAILNAALNEIFALHFKSLKSALQVDNISLRVKKFIDENYFSNITIDLIAKNFNFSRNYLYSLFKENYGISPQNYLLNLRIEKAKALLESEKQLSISEIALAVGYTDALYFSRLFHKKAGVSPTKYKTNKA